MITIRRKNGKFATDKKHKTKYTLEHPYRAVQLKFYAEQIKSFKLDEELSKKEKFKLQKQALKEVLQTMKKNFPKERYLVWGIVHYKDPRGDGFYDASVEKPHVHIWIINKKNSEHIRTIFNKLDILIRPEDEDMWSHAVDNIENKEACALYATHETVQAIKEGKVKYSLSDVVTNDRKAFLELRGIKEEADKKFTKEDWIRKDEEAYTLGYDFADWNEFYNQLPRSAKSKQIEIKLLREQYERGIQDKIEECPETLRCSIFIRGRNGIGKSHAIDYALKELNLKKLDVSGGGTGQFDKLNPFYEAVFVNDGTLPADSLLNIADGRNCNVYHRNQGNSYLCAKYLIVSSNLDFEEWCHTCKFKTFRIEKDNIGDKEIKKKVPLEVFFALRSRFFFIDVNSKDDIKVRYNTRGSIETIQKRLDMFQDFYNLFEESIKSYKPIKTEVYKAKNGKLKVRQIDDNER